MPEGHHTVTPHLVIRNASDANDFYQKALGAVELGRMHGPDGRIMHAELRIGDSRLFLCDEFPEYGSSSPQTLAGSPATTHLYVDDADADADAVFYKAVEAGAQAAMPLSNMFWGDRYGKHIDPFGHHWSIASHSEDLTPGQIQERAAAAFAKAC